MYRRIRRVETASSPRRSGKSRGFHRPRANGRSTRVSVSGHSPVSYSEQLDRVSNPWRPMAVFCRAKLRLVRPFAAGAVLAVCALMRAPAWAQSPDAVAGLLEEPTVHAALEAARQHESATIDDQVRFCEIPAPPFGEARRAAAYADAFRAAGLRGVRIDKAGNVLGQRPGRAARPHLVLSAHLDTVFPEGTAVG